jgi:hypothetical protein
LVRAGVDRLNELPLKSAGAAIALQTSLRRSNSRYAPPEGPPPSGPVLGVPAS